VAAFLLLLLFFAENPQPLLGGIGAVVTVLMFASPLSQMMVVVYSKSTETMSLPLSATSAAATLSWTLYGYLRGDAFVMVPNGLGLLLALLQLSLFVIYRNPLSPSTTNIGINYTV